MLFLTLTELLLGLSRAAFVQIHNEEYQLYEFYNDTQSIKLYNQIEDAGKLSSDEFLGGTQDKDMIFNTFQSFNVFNLKDNGTLVASAFVNRDLYFDMKKEPQKIASDASDLEIYDVLEIYSFAVSRDYRRRGISKAFLGAIVNRMKEKFSLGEETLVGLHVDPKDEMMDVSFALYIKLGFNRACVCGQQGPSCMKYHGGLISKLKHPVDVNAYDIASGGRGCHFLSMYTTLGHFMKGDVGIDTSKLIEIGKAIKDALSKKKLSRKAPGREGVLQ